MAAREAATVPVTAPSTALPPEAAVSSAENLVATIANQVLAGRDGGLGG